MKNKLLLAAVTVIILSMLATGTLAYFTAEDTAHNVITSGNVAIDLLEWADSDRTDPFPAEGVSGVMPGTQVTKVVEVKNTGLNEAWIRVSVLKSITLAEGVQGDVDLSLVQLDINDEKWTEKDGYYYYNEAVKPGQTTEPLFTAVTFDTTMGNLYQLSTANVEVLAQAVQTANNGATVLEAAGWPEITE